MRFSKKAAIQLTLSAIPTAPVRMLRRTGPRLRSIIVSTGCRCNCVADKRKPGTTNTRNVRARNLALRAQWEFRPTLSVFGELELEDRHHAAPSLSDNLSRNSKGERYRLGVALGQTGAYLRGEASIGYGVQRARSSALSDIRAFLVDANLA